MRKKNKGHPMIPEDAPKMSDKELASEIARLENHLLANAHFDNWSACPIPATDDDK